MWHTCVYCAQFRAQTDCQASRVVGKRRSGEISIRRVFITSDVGISTLKQYQSDNWKPCLVGPVVNVAVLEVVGSSPALANWGLRLSACYTVLRPQLDFKLMSLAVQVGSRWRRQGGSPYYVKRNQVTDKTTEKTGPGELHRLKVRWGSERGLAG